MRSHIHLFFIMWIPYIDAALQVASFLEIIVTAQYSKIPHGLRFATLCCVQVSTCCIYILQDLVTSTGRLPQCQSLSEAVVRNVVKYILHICKITDYFTDTTQSPTTSFACFTGCTIQTQALRTLPVLHTHWMSVIGPPSNIHTQHVTGRNPMTLQTHV